MYYSVAVFIGMCRNPRAVLASTHTHTRFSIGQGRTDYWLAETKFVCQMITDGRLRVHTYTGLDYKSVALSQVECMSYIM